LKGKRRRVRIQFSAGDSRSGFAGHYGDAGVYDTKVTCHYGDDGGTKVTGGIVCGLRADAMRECLLCVVFAVHELHELVNGHEREFVERVAEEDG
jgi:hypothetical protein